MKKILLKIQHFLVGDVNRILGGFSKLEAKLEKAVNFHALRAEEAKLAQAAAQEAERIAQAARTKAETVKNNISKLLGE